MGLKREKPSNFPIALKREFDVIVILSFELVSSFTISTLSTLLAFGTIPLNLLIYSGSWTDEEFVVPYMSILIVVGITITPLVLGVGIRWKFSKAASIILKVENTKRPP